MNFKSQIFGAYKKRQRSRKKVLKKLNSATRRMKNTMRRNKKNFAAHRLAGPFI